ncbi:MAG TPA: family 43 glycosylhydrolase, partial [bacterium]|nr:family 43 glycosylhydrolase [bacterium]
MAVKQNIEHYFNPILFADYSDPDVIRVGDDFYLVSSSFNHVPGLPVLHSCDLIHWQIIGHALQRLPSPRYDLAQPGNGVWAPSLRFYQNQFWIYYGDPDLGVFMVKSENPAGLWETPRLIQKAKGWIDPCPLWDDDGRA